MNHTPKLVFLFAALILLGLPTTAIAKPERFQAADSKGVEATRDGNTVYLKIDDGIKKSVTIPRLAAPLKSMSWQGSDIDGGIVLKPGLDTWQIQWKQKPKGQSVLVLAFGAEPLLMKEVKPVTASADGSFFLPAHLAVTRGEKIRYEPQPKKNTVGFWVGKKDSATWVIKLDKPGRFNVAVLQGCGRGQGGSKAKISFVFPVKDLTPSVEFDVLETGHFQNFQWRQLGEIELRHAVNTEVIVAPQVIKKAALMDIRAIHLIRLPDKKK